MQISEDLVEFIGILLGDGHLSEGHFTVSLNGIDEIDYVRYVEKLILNLFNIKPKRRWVRDGSSSPDDAKALILSVNSKEIVRELLDLGLQPGNKSINQVSLPKFVYSDKKHIIRSLKGLTDTDGSIFVDKSRGTIYVSFPNASKPLAKDFCKLCKSLDIDSNFYGPYYRFNPETKTTTKNYKVTILKKEDVKKFLKIINPEKWKDPYRRMFAGTILIGLQDKERFQKALNEIIETQQLNQFNYTRENAELLRETCERHGYEINKKLIEQAIEESFEFKYLMYSRETAEYMKDLAIQLGAFKQVTKHLNKKYKPTVINFVKRLFQEGEYISKYGDDAFNRWANSNFELLINETQNRMQRFSFDIKAMVCHEIYDIIQNNENIGMQMESNEIIPLLTEIINTKDLNGNIITSKAENSEEDVFLEEGPNVLKYERLSYLLSKSYSRNMVTKYFKKLVVFLNEIHGLKSLNRKFHLEDLRRHLRNEYNIHWRSKNLKKLLVKLDLYDGLIDEELQFDETESEIDNNGNDLTQSQSVEEKSEEVDLDVVDKEKSVHTSNFQSIPFPYDNKKHNFEDVDFTEIYTWISPQVREQMREKVESLQKEVLREVGLREDSIERNNYETLRRAREFDESLTHSERNLDANIHVDFNDVFDLPQEEFINGEDQDLLIGDESGDLLSQDQEYDSEEEISEELFSEDESYFDQEQELSESEFGPEEEVGSDSTLDEADINPPLSEESGIPEDPDNYPEPTTAKFPEEIIDSINEHMKGETPESAMGEGANQEDLDPLSKADDIQSESESIGERNSSLEGDDDQVDNDQNNPADKIQGQNIDETKEESSASNDKVSNREIDDDNSDDLDEGREPSQENTDDTSGITPEEDIYDPINVPINDLDPMISSFQSSSLGDYWHNFENSPQANFKDGFNEDQSVLAFDEVGEASTINKDALDDKIEDIIDDFSFV